MSEQDIPAYVKDVIARGMNEYFKAWNDNLKFGFGFVAGITGN